jgi:selenocysteine lyase/cysteine desulfurase
MGCWLSTLATELFSPIVNASGLRSEFPVLAEIAYLNAGTDGPLPRRAVQAARAELDRELAEGRAMAHFERRGELGKALRSAYARALRADPADVALTTSTTEGMGQVVMGMDLRPGDEILTSDEEHPGLQGALGAARDILGASIREVPFARVAEEVGPATRLVACSHVSWATGALAPAALADVEVPVLLDGAQGLGAIDVDVTALGCDAYAGAGQKWCCGPDGSGALWVAPELSSRLAVSRRGYGNLQEANAGLAAVVHEDARRFDAPSLSAEALACSLAAAEVLEEFGWPALWERARALAARLAEMLAERGREPLPRGESTLVSFPSPDAEAERAELADQGVLIRNIPGRGCLRASVGAWNDESDLDRLLGALRP